MPVVCLVSVSNHCSRVQYCFLVTSHFTCVKMTSNFMWANSANLPQMDLDMVFTFLSGKDAFNAPEVRGAKEARAGRESYGDTAVSFVELSRSGDLCTVECKMNPEQRLHTKPYPVVVVIDEKKERVESAECYGCKAGLGGCKHTVAFLLWLNRRWEEPASTSITCYWKKSVLATVGRELKPCTLLDFGGKPKPPKTGNAFLKDLLSVDRNSILHSFFLEKRHVEKLSLHFITRLASKDNSRSVEEHASLLMTNALCKEAERETRGQFGTPLWSELRYGRITASKAYEAAQCQTPNGSLVNQIIGAVKIRDTEAMARGRLLEDEVLEFVSKRLGRKFKKAGLYLRSDFPWIGASPDGIDDTYVVEIKCPKKELALKNYFSDCGIIKSKFQAQVQLEMFCANRTMALFCVADPNFEVTHHVTMIVVEYNEKYVHALLPKMKLFWHNFILPRII